MTDCPPAPAPGSPSSRDHRALEPSSVPSSRPRPRLAALLLATACSRPCVVYAEVSSVQEVVDHPDANFLTIAATPALEYHTRARYIEVFYVTSRQEEPREYWVVPLLDPGTSIGDDRVVYAWVMAGGTRYPDEDIEPWLQSVAATFDGTPTRHRVPARVSDYERRRALRLRGIREAERLHNLKSHPNAPIFVVK